LRWLAPAPPGSTPRSARAREGARWCSSRPRPLAQQPPTGAQGGLAAALAADDSFELHLTDTERAGRALVRRSAAEILVREAPACVHDLQALGVRFDADRSGRLALGLEGRGTPVKARRARRRLRDRPPVGTPTVGARCRRAADRRVRGREGTCAVAFRRPLSRSDLWTTVGSSPPRASVLRTGGRRRRLWARTTNPARLARGRPAARPRRRAQRWRISSLLAVPPTGRDRARWARRLPRHRGDPRRGRGPCTTARRASASSTSSPPATRSPALSALAPTPDRPALAASTCARSTPPTSPTWVASLREAGLDPSAS